MGSIRATLDRRTMLGAVILVAAVIVIVALTLGMGATKDLDVYLLAGRRFAHAEDLYGAGFGQGLDTPLPYTYPPLWAGAMALVAWLPWSWVTIAWTALDVALLVWVVQRSYAGLLERLGPRRPIALACLVGVLGLTAPVLGVFDLGQLGLVLLALVLADTLPERSRLPRGVLVGVATAIKLLPGVFLLYWAATRRWAAAATAGAVAVGLWCLAAMLRPDQSATYWLGLATHPERAGDATTALDQSTHGLLLRAGWTSPVLWAALAVVALVIGVRRARSAHLAGDELAAISLIGIAGLLVSPISWIHHFVWIVPATGVLLGDGTDRRRRIAWAATIAVFALDVPLWSKVLPLDGIVRTVTDNAFVLASWALLLFLPVSSPRQERRLGSVVVSGTREYAGAR